MLGWGDTVLLVMSRLDVDYVPAYANKPNYYVLSINPPFGNERAIASTILSTCLD